MKIAGYLKTSLIEWPGKICSVIFTPGCNFRCPFCHNRDLVLGQGVSQIPEKQILADLKRREKWIDAVAITGGEPTLQAGLLKFLKLLKSLKLLTMIQTNGTKPGVIEQLVISKLVDYFCLDLKGDLQNYEKFCNIKYHIPEEFPGGNISNVKSSMELIIRGGVEYEFRTTVVPGLHNLENLEKLAVQINEVFENCKLKISESLISPLKAAQIENSRWFLQQFSPLNTLDRRYLKVKPYSKEEMEAFQKQLQKIIPQTLLRGV